MKNNVECYIINEAGTDINWFRAVEKMDEAIWASINRQFKGSSKTINDFWAAYCAAHRKKYGAEFPPNTAGYNLTSGNR